MSGKVVPATNAADALPAAGAHPAETEIRPSKAADPSNSTNPSDLRLIIEQTNDPGQYVYTILDQRTGRIISQLPRDAVLRLKEKPDYAAGAIFNGKA